MSQNTLAQSTWSRLLMLSVTLPLLSGSAFAQNPLTGIHTQKEEKILTPEERERQKQIDADYKAATNKIPDQKAADPWTGVRETPALPASKKKQQ